MSLVSVVCCLLFVNCLLFVVWLLAAGCCYCALCVVCCCFGVGCALRGVVWWLLFVVLCGLWCCVLFVGCRCCLKCGALYAVRCALRVVRCSLFVVRCRLRVACVVFCWLLFGVVWCLMSDKVCCSLVFLGVARCSLHVSCWSLRVGRCCLLLPVLCYLLFVG